ncbi:hypothetical protein BDR26DRAFT_31645 [Obelidium mucronatum]|nr:hypothetical protein BDR26DRAFT_31645 [Obelidium mucronatum]
MQAIELKQAGDLHVSDEAKQELTANKHALTKDKVLIRWAIIIFVFLCFSWAAQWASIILPYWRGDQYHVGGLFQICGNTKFSYDGNTIQPDRPHEWRCEKFEDYVDDFQSIFPKDTEWYIQAGSAKKLIVVSRWFESLTTSFDMVFGTMAIWAVIYPHYDPKIQKRNMITAVIGCMLPPAFALVDGFVQNSYWEEIGVGMFNDDIQTFFYASGDIAWISTSVDVVLQISFLAYGVRRQHRLAQQGDQVAMRADVA